MAAAALAGVPAVEPEAQAAVLVERAAALVRADHPEAEVAQVVAAVLVAVLEALAVEAAALTLADMDQAQDLEPVMY